MAVHCITYSSSLIFLAFDTRCHIDSKAYLPFLLPWELGKFKLEFLMKRSAVENTLNGQKQRKLWKSEDSKPEPDLDCPAPLTREDRGGSSAAPEHTHEQISWRDVAQQVCFGTGDIDPEPQAYFAFCNSWRRLSDYVAHLAKMFEAGFKDPVTGESVPCSLTRDLTLFLAQCQ